jgi:hypothetical protein
LAGGIIIIDWGEPLILTDGIIIIDGCELFMFGGIIIIDGAWGIIMDW